MMNALHLASGLLGLAGGVMFAQAQAASFPLPPPGESVIGAPQYTTTHFEDTLLDLARHYNLGHNEIEIANPEVDMWLPGEGTEIVLPTRFILPDAPREGVVVNIAEMRLYYYPAPENGVPARVVTYPISIGRVDWQTPLGATRVIDKIENPHWYPPESVRKEHAEAGDPLPEVVPPGPDNPLGAYKIRLGLPGYLIHGTNQPYGIGMRVTHGCIRMYPEDVEVLFEAAPVGTPVYIVNQPYKAGWQDGTLYMEVHPPLDEVPMEDAEGIVDEGREPAEAKTPPVVNLTPMVAAVMGATRGKPKYPVDWERVETVARQARGMPLPVAKGVESAIQSARMDDEGAAREAAGESSPTADGEAPAGEAAGISTIESQYRRKMPAASELREAAEPQEKPRPGIEPFDPGAGFQY